MPLLFQTVSYILPYRCHHHLGIAPQLPPSESALFRFLGILDETGRSVPISSGDSPQGKVTIKRSTINENNEKRRTDG